MIRNYLTIAFRALWRNKIHSLITIAGLALGIMCCLLIALFVHEEWTYDTFHSKADRIYRVYVKENWGENQEFFNTTTPFPIGPALKDNLEEVEAYVRVVQAGTQVKINDQLFPESLTIADRNLFTVFDFELLKGDRNTILDQPGKVVLSEEAALKYFGETDPIQKTLLFTLGENTESFVVSGVASIPTNSSIQFDILISDQNLIKLYPEKVLTSAWFNISPETYVLLQEGVNVASVTTKFPDLFKKLIGEEDFKQSKYAPGLQALTSIHLDNTYPAGIAPVSNPRYSYILVAISSLILIIACINFITLSIGRSVKRAKEVGIRKVVGAERQQLIFQFIGEAVLLTIISMIIGLLLAKLSLPVFNDLAGRQLVFPFSGFMLSTIFTLLFVIGLLAGSYPAFVLSGFKPIAILKGKLQTSGSKQGIRKVLVGVQLLLSIFLISSTLMMKKQLDYLQNKDLGFNREQLGTMQLVVSQQGKLSERIVKGFEIAEQFKTELAKLPDVISACASSQDFGHGNWMGVGFTDDKGAYHNFNLNTVDDDYIPTLKMELVAGRNFSDANTSDKRRGVIVNETFAHEYGWDDAIGKKIPGKNFLDHEIIGVVKDFHYAALYTKVQPLVMVQDPVIILKGVENVNISNSPLPKIIARLNPGNMVVTIDQIKGVWEKLTNGEEFAFNFVDEAMQAQYQDDQNLGRIVRIATILAIIIGSLGLYGLASLAMQSRVKEIGIRKVLGASEKSLLVLLSKEYAIMLLICLALSIPITIYSMQEWLSSFEYRASIDAGIFLLAGGLAIAIAFVTIGYQTMHTARTQPTETLKQE